MMAEATATATTTTKPTATALTTTTTTTMAATRTTTAATTTAATKGEEEEGEFDDIFHLFVCCLFDSCTKRFEALHSWEGKSYWSVCVCVSCVYVCELCIHVWEREREWQERGSVRMGDRGKRVEWKVIKRYEKQSIDPEGRRKLAEIEKSLPKKEIRISKKIFWVFENLCNRQIEI